MRLGGILNGASVGGTSTWIAAATSTLQSDGRLMAATSAESARIGMGNVPKATIPARRSFNQRSGIERRRFVERTDTTFEHEIAFRGRNQLRSHVAAELIAA